MHDPNPNGFFANLPKRVFDLTGFRLGDILKLVAVVLAAVVGIGYIVLYADGEKDGEPSDPNTVISRGPSDEEKLRDISQLPGQFSNLQPVEQLGLLSSKIELGEELANTSDEFKEQAIEQLVPLYGARCNIEESTGMDSEQTYLRIAGLRQEALAAGNSKRVATLDFYRALAATNRLTLRGERADFRFATDAVLSLESKNLTNPSEATKLFAYAIRVQQYSPDPSSAKIFLSILADKMSGSPEPQVSKIGRSLEDYPKYHPFYEAAMELPDSSREARLQLYKDLFALIKDSPPRSAATYKIIVRLLDRLVNRADVNTARILIQRVSEIAENADPEIKVMVDESIENIQKRIASLGSKVDLAGATHDGSPLQLPNGKPTTLVFWRPNVVESSDYVRNLVESNLFDQWNSNVLVVCQSELSKEQLYNAASEVSNFTITDNATSKRLANEFGIDLVPYQISLDKDGVVLRLGAAAN